MSEQKHYAAITPPWLEGFEKEAGYMPEQKDKLREKILNTISSNARTIGASLVGYCQADFGDLATLIEPLIEEAREEAFDKGVKRGTTIRNIDWCSENHHRHGEKMRKAIAEAKKQGEDRVLGMMTDCFGGNKLILARDLETLKEDNDG